MNHDRTMWASVSVCHCSSVLRWSEISDSGADPKVLAKGLFLALWAAIIIITIFITHTKRHSTSHNFVLPKLRPLASGLAFAFKGYSVFNLYKTLS